ncbi:MAG: tetratricopeptide repeat protein [Candidatus Rokubacteria bacterium]|nr:tetratricopeptide repeat protein [Candidatus Rokubacteria bacterium]MBI3826861.1 tetratricopeptide repeat protein [Candidatus Rokubacteria bacterium]
MSHRRLTIFAVAALGALVGSGAAGTEITPRAVLVLPFDASGLASGDQWMGEGIAQLISLGLARHPAFAQVERARLGTVSGADLWSEMQVRQAAHDVHADAALYGRIGRKDTALVLEPRLLDLKRDHPETMSLEPMTMADADLVTSVASLPAAYARALGVALTDHECDRIERAARPTRSLRALELFTGAQMAFDAGAHARAADLLGRALAVDSTFPVAQYTLGVIHAALGNRWKAAVQFRAATQIDPAFPEPYKALGDLFLGAPRQLFNQAIEAYSFAIKLRPFYADAHVGLGDARAAKGDAEGATAAYRAALALDPVNPRTHLRLGKIYAAQGRCFDAANAYARAIELDPRAAEARLGVPEDVCLQLAR